MKGKRISIVIPANNEVESIDNSIKAIEKVIPSMYQSEIIVVDDGSKDTTWERIEFLSKEYENVKGICFSRNFGKEAAIMAGLAYSSGDAVITIDADLQHPPDKIPEFIKKWEDGAQIVEGIKANRGKENAIHSVFASRFYKLMNRAVGGGRFTEYK